MPTSLAANRTREIRLSGMRGGLAETWTMVMAKRARTAETPKQPSLGLWLRAPYFYPTNQAATENTNFTLRSGEFPAYSKAV